MYMYSEFYIHCPFSKSLHIQSQPIRLSLQVRKIDHIDFIFSFTGGNTEILSQRAVKPKTNQPTIVNENGFSKLFINRCCVQNIQ